MKLPKVEIFTPINHSEKMFLFSSFMLNNGHSHSPGFRFFKFKGIFSIEFCPLNTHSIIVIGLFVEEKIN